MQSSLAFESTPDGIILDVKVVAGASRDQIVGRLGSVLKIKTSAPPQAGKANQAVCALLARTLNVSKRDVSVIAGRTNPNKRLRITGLTADQAADRLASQLK